MHPDLEEAIDFHDAIVAEGGKALVGYETAKALANVVLLSEIPTTYDKKEQRQVNAGNLLLRGVPGVGKTFFGVILAAISNAKFARIQGRADLQPTEVVGFQMINPATGELDHRVRAAGLGRSHPARRDQPHPAQVAERVPRRPAGPHGHGRQDDLRAAGVQLRDRDDEPGRARAGHVPAVGSGDRSLRDHGEHRLPAARGRSEARQLRLQAGAPEPADVEGAHHPAARAPSASRCSCTSGSAIYIQRLVARDAAVQPRHRLARRTRRPSWSSTASTSARRRARSSAGAGSPRSGRCSSARRDEVYPEDIQDLAPYVLGHRIWLGPHAASHGLTTEAVIEDVIERVRDSMRTPRAGRRAARQPLGASPRSSCSSCKRMREFTIGDHRSVFHGTGFDFVGLRDWQAGRSLRVDRLGAVVAHELQPAHRPRVRAAEHGHASSRSPTRRCRRAAASTACRSRPRSRGRSARSACRRCSFRTCSA